MNGVTVSGANVGVTVQGYTTTYSDASSVCSMLSMTACYSLQLAQCNNFGTGTVAATVTTTAGNGFVNGARALRATGCPEMMFALGAAAVAGVVGGVM